MLAVRFIVPMLFLFLSACAGTLRGTPGIIDSNGVVGVAEAEYSITEQNRTFRQQFATDFRAARLSPDDPALRSNMMSSGQTLVRVNCNDFFANAAILQRDSRIGRDMVAPIFSILSGIMSLRTLSSDASSELSQIFSLSSSAILSGISLVDAHFLFGAENIDEVRELTFKALDSDEEGLAQGGTPTFDDGVAQLMEHQIICTPAHILRRTREAIQAGTVEHEVSVGQAADLAALRSLGTALHLTGAATDAQALALWALYRNGYRANNALPDKLVAQLNTLHLGDLVGADKKMSALGGTEAANINTALERFSPESQARLTRNARAFDVSTAAVDRAQQYIAQYALQQTARDRTMSLALGEDQEENQRRDLLIESFALPNSGTHPRVRLRVR
jgi:hypothetical protein